MAWLTEYMCLAAYERPIGPHQSWSATFTLGTIHVLRKQFLGYEGWQSALK